MKKILLVALLLGLCAYVGDAQTVVTAAQLDPNTDAVGGAYAQTGGSKAFGDLIYEWSPEDLTLDIRCLGVEMDDTNWWVTGANDMAGAFLYRFDAANTTLLNSYPQGNTGWGWRDIAYDGTYLYCSDSFVIEEVDPATGGVTGTTIASPISPARALAYDSVRDLFWTGSFSSDIYSVTRGGTSTAYGTILGGTYGAAYDTPTDMVWIWDQTSGSGVNAHEFNPATGTFTGNNWDGDSGLVGIAGGACIFDHTTHGHVFAGLQQAAPDTVSVYEFGQGPVPASVDVKVDGSDAGVVINDGDNVVIDIYVTAGADAGLNSDIWVLVKNDAGKRWSYSKAAGRWYKGWCTEYVSEPLDNHAETVLDMALPIGGYDAYIGIDTDMNGMLNINALLVYDHCDFEVVGYTPPLYDNGSTDGTNGYFYSADYSAGLTVSILDDFVIPGGETWTIDGFNDTAVAAGNLTGFFVDFLADAAGAPGASVATATGVVASEAVTGLTWFGFPEYAHTVTFDPVVLGAGTYWVEVAPYTGGSYQYGMIKSTVTGTELWWRDTGVFGGYFGPGTGQFGVPADLGFQLQGTK